MCSVIFVTVVDSCVLVNGGAAASLYFVVVRGMFFVCLNRGRSGVTDIQTYSDFGRVFPTFWAQSKLETKPPSFFARNKWGYELDDYCSRRLSY